MVFPTFISRMKRKLLFIIFLWLNLPAQAQKDFDYTIYTSKADFENLDSTKTKCNLFLPRKIQKEANTLKIISTTNTAITELYTLEYIGYRPDNESFAYRVKDEITIYVNPVAAVVKIEFAKIKTKVIYY